MSFPARAVEEARPRPTPGATSWVATRALDIAVVAGLLVMTGLVHAIGMARWPAFFDDEGTYVSQAWAVVKLHSLGPYTYWYDHPPLGWLLLGAWSWVVPTFGPDRFAIASARLFIFALFLLCVVFVYVIALRLGLRRPFAALAVALFALTPLGLHYQRMVLLDNIGLAWLLAALMLALSPSRRLAAYAGAGVCLAAAVLTKETFLLFAPAVLLAVWHSSGAGASSRRFAVGVFVTLFVLIGAFYPLFAVLRGEFLQGAGHTSLLYGIKYQLSRPGTGSFLTATSATRDIVAGWFRTDPYVLGLGTLLLPIGFALRRLRPAALGLGLALLVVVARPNGYLPPMFVVGMLPFAALLAAAGVDWLVRLGSIRDAPRRVTSHGAHVYAGGSARPQGPRLAALAAGVAVLAALALMAGPRWFASDRTAMRSDPASASRQAVAWLDANASRRSYLLVDNSVWTDLVTRGFSRQRTIWYSKLDLDPTLGGVRWDRFTYVVRSSLVPLRDWGPNARNVWRNSRPVVTFRSGGDRVAIRRVTGPSTVAAANTP